MVPSNVNAVTVLIAGTQLWEDVKITESKPGKPVAVGSAGVTEP